MPDLSTTMTKMEAGETTVGQQPQGSILTVMPEIGMAILEQHKEDPKRGLTH